MGRRQSIRLQPLDSPARHQSYDHLHAYVCMCMCMCVYVCMYVCIACPYTFNIYHKLYISTYTCICRHRTGQLPSEPITSLQKRVCSRAHLRSVVEHLNGHPWGVKRCVIPEIFFLFPFITQTNTSPRSHSPFSPATSLGAAIPRSLGLRIAATIPHRPEMASEACQKVLLKKNHTFDILKKM